MADLTRGAIAGFLAGIVFGIISIIYTAVNWVIALGIMLDLGAVIAFLIFAIIPVIVGASLAGLIFGLVYAATYDSLPGSTSMKKGVSFSVMFWLIIYVVPGCVPLLLIPGYPLDWVDFVVNNVTVGLTVSLAWGLTLGWVWDRVGEDHVAATTTERADSTGKRVKCEGKSDYGNAGFVDGKDANVDI